MKKLFFIIVLHFLLSLHALAQQPQLPKTDINIEGLVGKVQRIEEEKAEVKMKNGVLREVKRHRTRTIIFDKQGRKTYEWIQISSLSPREHNYSYDKKNNRHRRTSFINHFSSEPNRIGKEQLSLGVIRFDATENAIFEDVYNNNKQLPEFLTQRYKFRFDSNGRLIEKIMLSIKGEEVMKDTLLYGTENLPIERRLSNPGNPFQQTFKYKYLLDSQGNWIQQTGENTIAKKDAIPQTEITYRKISYYK